MTRPKPPNARAGAAARTPSAPRTVAFDIHPTTGRRVRLPSYRLHKGSGQGVIRIDGTSYYLGPYDERPGAPGRLRAERLLEEWRANGYRLPAHRADQILGRRGRAAPPDAGPIAAGLTVRDLVADYLEHLDVRPADRRYSPSEMEWIRHSVRPLLERFGDLAVHEFQLADLRSIRDAWATGTAGRDGAPLSEATVKGRVSRLKRLFKWAATERDGIVPPALWMQIANLSGAAPSAKRAKVRHVATDAEVERLVELLPRRVAVLLQVQAETGMRVSEACRLRSRDVDRTRDPWIFTPAPSADPRDVSTGRARLAHKTANAKSGGKVLSYRIPRSAQKLLEPFVVDDDPDRYWLRPCDQVAEMHRIRSATRRQTRSRAQKRGREPRGRGGETYNKDTIGHAIRKVRDEAGCPGFTTHALRRYFAARMRRLGFSQDDARLILGHESTTVTRLYSESADEDVRDRVMERFAAAVEQEGRTP